ncbi:hypothetical protein EAG_12129 [Camponotus floridanus]|uniref:Uncharacterized protein n=1 Tax=Camponotus floridanus TaxID=104421 RepID=E2B0G3_CAMFO|nr:hypothetical protein EAG_12129 [Camponotus floridanus]
MGELIPTSESRRIGAEIYGPMEDPMQGGWLARLQSCRTVALENSLFSSKLPDYGSHRPGSRNPDVLPTILIGNGDTCESVYVLLP